MLREHENQPIRDVEPRTFKARFGRLQQLVDPFKLAFLKEDTLSYNISKNQRYVFPYFREKVENVSESKFARFGLG